tara:strand:+ start:463 stop:1653 length:1191 start_codon:yes stop_codon:yes gene_type:complete
MKDEVKLPDFQVEETLQTLSQTADWSINQMNIPVAWRESQGEGIKIAVLDTGHPTHSELVENCLHGISTTGEDNFLDVNGHQTHCTGIICASNNNTGTVGVAPKAQCISVKVLSDSGSGSWDSVARGLEYCLDSGVDIVSMSLGGSRPSPMIEAQIKGLYELGIPVICAAGNSGQGGVNWPAAYDETIAVGAFDKYGKVASFSSRGDKVEWAAPGVDILSTYINNRYARLSGTSMACPFMVGIVALMLSKHRKQEQDTGMNDCSTVEQIREHLLKYTMDKGRLGKDNSWGYGVIDVKGMFGSSSNSSKSSSSISSQSSSSQSSSSSSSSASSQSSKPEFHDGKAPVGLLPWGFLGLFIAILLTMFVISKCTDDDVDIQELPQSFWDKKYQNDINNK